MNSIINYEKIRIANSNDIAQLKQLNIPFHYKQDIEIELEGDHANNFIWFLYEVEKKILGLHRVMIISGWAFWSGVFIQPNCKNIWIMSKLIRNSYEYMNNSSLQGQLGWVDSIYDSKSKMLDRFGFNLHPVEVYRLIYKFNNNKKNNKAFSIKTHLSSEKWRHSIKSDYIKIRNLVLISNSYINKLSEVNYDKASKWFILECGEEIIAAINWWKHGETLEIHSLISQTYDFDITNGIVHLVSDVFTNEIGILKINVESYRKITILRLISLGKDVCMHNNKTLLYKKL